MGVIAVAVKHLVQAGVGPEGILAAVTELESALDEARVQDLARISREIVRPMTGAERTRKWRAKQVDTTENSCDVCDAVTLNVTKEKVSHTLPKENNIPPVLDKSNTSPQTQKPDQNQPLAKNPIFPSLSFDDFWKVWPRRVGKGAARRAWDKAMRHPQGGAAAVMQGAEGAARQYQHTEPQFIPHPATWLNQERWLDEGCTAKVVVPFVQVRAKRTWAEIQAEMAQDRSNVVEFPAVAAANAWMAVEGEDLDALVCRDDQGPQGGPGAEEPQGAGLLDILPALQAMDNSQEN